MEDGRGGKQGGGGGGHGDGAGEEERVEGRPEKEDEMVREKKNIGCLAGLARMLKSGRWGKSSGCIEC